MNKTTLTEKQLEALDHFSSIYGRCWKRELNINWMQGNYSSAVDVGTLQGIRNQFGPSWLVKFSFNKPLTHSTKE